MEASSALVEEVARKASAKLELPAMDDESEEGSGDASGAEGGDHHRPLPSAEELSQFAIENLFASPLFASSDEKAESLEQPQQQLNVTAGDLTFGEDTENEDILLEGLQEELESYQGREIVSNILGKKGSELRAYAREVDEKLRQVELESIQLADTKPTRAMATLSLPISASGALFFMLPGAGATPESTQASGASTAELLCAWFACASLLLSLATFGLTLSSSGKFWWEARKKSNERRSTLLPPWVAAAQALEASLESLDRDVARLGRESDAHIKLNRLVYDFMVFCKTHHEVFLSADLIGVRDEDLHSVTKALSCGSSVFRFDSSDVFFLAALVSSGLDFEEFESKAMNDTVFRAEAERIWSWILSYGVLLERPLQDQPREAAVKKIQNISRALKNVKDKYGMKHFKVLGFFERMKIIIHKTTKL